jgi:SAM-dependent methyltransferase
MTSPSTEWFADESLWEALYPFAFTDSVLASGEEQIEKVVRLTGVERGAVLDLCCGPGRHSVALAKRGFAVTAVDRSPFLLNKARARAAEAGVKIEFVAEDMRRFIRPAAFDLVVNIFTSFGYFDDPADNRKVVDLVRESLKPGGVFLLEMVSKECVARMFHPTTSTELPNGDVLVQRHEVIDDWARIRNRWTLISSGVARTFEFRHWLYSGAEMKDLLTRAGFNDARVYGDLDGHPYGLDALRLVAVARK